MARSRARLGSEETAVMVTIEEDGSAAPVRKPPRSCRPRDWDTDWATAAELATH